MEHKEQHANRGGAAVLLLVAVIGLSASLAASAWIRSGEQRRLRQVVSQRAHDLQVMLAGRVREYNLAAWYLRNSLMRIGPEDSRAFRGTALGLLARFPELQAVEWSPRIPGGGRAGLEATMRANGHPDFGIAEPDGAGGMRVADERDDYCVICFIEPLAGNERALGLDLFRAQSADVVRVARDERMMRLTTPIRLVQEAGESAGVVLYIPFFKAAKEGEESDRDGPRARFAGVFQLVFRVNDMFGKLLNSEVVRQAAFLPRRMPEDDGLVDDNPQIHRDLLTGMDLLIVDRDSRDIAFFRPAPLRESALAAATRAEFVADDAAVEEVHFSGRYWELLVRPAPEFIAQHLSLLPAGALGTGTAFTLLLLAYVVTVQRRSQDVEELVEDRTSDLERTVGELQDRSQRLRTVEATLTELGRMRVLKGDGLERRFEQVCERVARAFAIDRVGVWLFDDEGKSLCCRAEFRLASGAFSRGATIEAAEFPKYFASLTQNRVIAAVNAGEDPRTAELVETYLKPENVFSLLDAPIRKGREVVGAICHESEGGHRRWSQEEQTLAAAIGDFLGMMLVEADRMAAEDRLRESEGLYSSLVANLPQWVFRKDLEGRFTFVNEQFAEAFGCEPATMIGRVDSDFSAPEQARRFREDDQRVFETGESLEFVEQVSLPTGRVYLHTSKTPLRDGDGGIVGLQGISWDVSERFRLQEALHASDERFRGLVDRLDCIVWEADPTTPGFPFTFVSRQVEEMLGFPATLLLEEADFWGRHVDPADREKVHAAMVAAVKTGQDTTLEYRMTAVDGHTVWLRDLVSVDTDGKGDVTGLRGVMVDITEARRMEAELLVSAERMKIFIERAPTAVAMLDRSMRYVIASRRWYEENDFEGRDIIGLRHYELVPEIPERWRRIHEHCLRGNSASCEEDPFPRPDGRTDFVRWEIHPWHETDGVVGGIVMFSEIITEKVRARQALQRGEAILQATGRAAELLLKAGSWQEVMPEVFAGLGKATGGSRLRLLQNVIGHGAMHARVQAEWSHDAATCSVVEVDWENRLMAEWRGRLAAGTVVQLNRNEVSPAAREVLSMRELSAVFLLPVVVRRAWWGTLAIEHVDEEREWSAAEIGALKGAADNLAAAIERELANHERIELERGMQDAQKLESLGVLAGGIAHDFNNLLTAIVGNAGLLRLDLDKSSRLNASIDIIENTAMRASDLCRQLLAYAGKGRFEMKPVDLNSVVRDTAELLRVSISKKAVLEQSLAADLGTVMADAAQLRQIVMNLVINASEAIGDRPGTISLRSVMRTLSAAELGDAWQGVKPDAREYVSLEIADDGCGMSEETVRRVFEPFFTTKFTGRGLGMAAVLGIVKSHHGALKVESGEGRGTRFELLLPPLREEVPTETNGPATKVTELPPGRRILIVEDEEDVRRVADSMCRKWGLLTDTAEDGTRGVETFAADPDAFDLVLLDLTMPGLDGIEVAGRMRAIRPGVKILMVSGYDDAGRVDGNPPEEIDGFVQKPYRWSLLKAKLAELLG